MSGYCRTALSTLCRSFGGRYPSKTFIQIKLSQAQALRLFGDRCDQPRYHHWSTHHTRTALLNVKSTWRSCQSSSQSNQSSEAGAPIKEDEYPPLPEYDANTQLESKEVFIVSVKGLPFSCRKEDLLEFFSECRVREGVKGVHFLYHRDGRPKGQAFVEVETEEDVSKALERHRQYLGPRYVEVFEVTDQDAEAMLRGGDNPMAGGSVVRLRGLPFTCTEEDIVHFFSGLDIVEGGVTLVQNFRGQNSGQAFVQFASQEMADKALERDRAVMGHRYVEVFSSSTSEIVSQYRRRAEQPPIPPSNGPPPPYRPPPPNRPPPPSTPPPPLSPPSASAVEMTGVQQLRAGRSAATQSSAVPIHYIHMRGLPFEATAEDIVRFFAPLRVARIMMEYYSDGKASGEAEVHFRSHEEAVAAMSRDREYMQNRYIELFLNSSRGR